MKFGFLEILHFFTAFQLLLFSSFLLSLKKGKRLSNFILAVFLSSKALGIINYLIFKFELSNPSLFFILLPFAFLYGPSLYFYVRSLAYRDFSFRWIHTVHLLPFLSISTYFTVVYHVQNTEVKMRILTGMRDLLPIQGILIISLLHGLIFCYLAASFFILWNYRKQLQRIFSSTEKINISWLNYVLTGYSLIWMIDVSSFVLARISFPRPLLGASSLTLVFVFANIIVYKGLRQPEIFNGIEEKHKYIHSRLTQLDKDRYLRRLQAYMLEEKPYLNPSLTINELGRKISISPRDISQIINESLGINFFDFVNGYRVEEAKRLLADSSNHDKNILNILFEAGFNTKSVFNRVFKKQTGMTPSAFRKANQT